MPCRGWWQRRRGGRPSRGVTTDDGAEQRERPGRHFQPVPRHDVVLEDGDAMERPAVAVARGALAVSARARRLLERVGVDLDDGVEKRVEAGDLALGTSDQG